MPNPKYLEIGYHPRLSDIGLRYDQPLEPVPSGLDRDRQGPLDGSNFAFQTQFAHQKVFLQPFPVAHLFGSSQDPHRNRQVKCRPTLPDIGRRQVYNDLCTGHFVPIRGDRTFDPLDTLFHSAVRQADNNVVLSLRIPVHFHRDRQGLHPKHRTSKRLYEHDTKVQAHRGHAMRYSP